MVSSGNNTQKTLADVIYDVSENPSLTQNFVQTTIQNFGLDHEVTVSMPSNPVELQRKAQNFFFFATQLRNTTPLIMLLGYLLF